MAQTITLNFKIIGQSLERLDDNRIVEKAKNYVNAHFEFNELWDDTTKAILIEGSGLRYKVYLNENNECSIPNRVVRYDGFTLTVVGEDDDKNITITTNDLFISILSNNATDDTPSYVEEIESDTLDVTREGEKYNIEIPDTYENYYRVTTNDIINFEPTQQYNLFKVTISQKLKEEILSFKKTFIIDWENDFSELSPVADFVTLTNYKPFKIYKLVDNIYRYVFSSVDTTSNISVMFYEENNEWYCGFTSIIFENLEIRIGQVETDVADKSKVVANPTLSGDEPDLEGAEIDGIKYKVGGGGSLYRHQILEKAANSAVLEFVIINNNPTAYTQTTILDFLNTNASEAVPYVANGKVKERNVEYQVLGVYKYPNTSYPHGVCYIADVNTVSTTGFPSFTTFTDVVTQV